MITILKNTVGIVICILTVIFLTRINTLLWEKSGVLNFFSQTLEKDIPNRKRQIIIFYWDNHINLNENHPIAYSAENDPLYEYRNEIIQTGGSVSSIPPTRWFPIE